MTRLEEIGKKIASLNLWNAAAPFNWAVKPRGVAFPYFCSLLKPNQLVAGHLVLLDGWQTFHDFIMTRCDNSFGFYSSPAEFPHYAMIATKDGKVAFFRNDTGFLPRVEFSEHEIAVLCKILWEVYGVMMRFESEPNLAMKYSEDNAIFSRVEAADGTWSDQPLPIIQPRVHVERVALRKDDLTAAKELPRLLGGETVTAPLSLEFTDAEEAQPADPEKARVLTSMLAYARKATGEPVVVPQAGNAFTMQVLYRLGFHWNPTPAEYVEQFLNALEGMGYFDWEE